MESKSQHQADIERKAIISSESVFEGKVFSVRKDTIQYDDNKTIVREVVDHADAVAILAINPEGKIVLVKQYRRPTDEILLELPAGIIDPGEKPIETAQRELQEETGYKAEKLTKIGGFYSSAGFSNEFVHLFLGEQLHNVALSPDEDEAIDLVSLTPDEVEEMIQKQQIRDAKTFGGLLYYFYSKYKK